MTPRGKEKKEWNNEFGNPVFVVPFEQCHGNQWLGRDAHLMNEEQQCVVCGAYMPSDTTACDPNSDRQVVSRGNKYVAVRVNKHNSTHYYSLYVEVEDAKTRRS